MVKVLFVTFCVVLLVALLIVLFLGSVIVSLDLIQGINDEWENINARKNRKKGK